MKAAIKEQISQSTVPQMTLLMANKSFTNHYIH